MKKTFERGDLEYWLHLTRGEWQLLFSLGFAWMAAELFPKGCRSHDQQFRHLIAHLQRECGYEFVGLVLDQNDELRARAEEYACEENILSIELMRKGVCPDLMVHLPAALAYARDHVPGLDTDPIIDALSQLSDVEQQIRERQVELPIEVKELLREKLRRRAEAIRQMNPQEVN